MSREERSQQTWHDLSPLEKGFAIIELAIVAVLILVPEGVRMLWCKALGEEYEPPHYRLAKRVQDD